MTSWLLEPEGHPVQQANLGVVLSNQAVGQPVLERAPPTTERPSTPFFRLAFEAAAQQGRFREPHHRLLSESARLGRTGLAEHATQPGMDPAELLRPASERPPRSTPTSSAQRPPLSPVHSAPARGRCR